MSQITLLRRMIQEENAKLDGLQEQCRLQEWHLRRLEERLKAIEDDGSNNRLIINLQMGLPDQIRELLRQQKRAMKAKDISELLENYGVTSRSARGLLTMVLATLNRRTDLFQRVAWGTYDLKKR